MSGFFSDRVPALVGLTCMFLLFGCVPKSKLEAAKEEKADCMAKKKELEETKKELQARNDSLVAENGSLKEAGPTERAVDSLKLKVDSLRSRNQVVEDSLESLKRTMRKHRQNLGDIYDKYRQLEDRICNGNL